MKNKKSELNHMLYTDNGECCACQFLRLALQMMAPEYRPEIQQLLDEAIAMHASEQVELWPPVTREVSAWH